MRLAARLMAVVALLAMATWALAQSPKNDPPIDDNTFVAKAAACSKCEVMLAELAKNQAANPDIKKFAERLITDHTKANEQLITAARAAKITVPDRLPEDLVKEYDRCKNLKGAEFDKAYVKHMVDGHEKAVKLFENASRNVKDPGLREFATKALPTIKEHLEQVKKFSGTR
jgi:putative membrane protein